MVKNVEEKIFTLADSSERVSSSTVAFIVLWLFVFFVAVIFDKLTLFLIIGSAPQLFGQCIGVFLQSFSKWACDKKKKEAGNQHLHGYRRIIYL